MTSQEFGGSWTQEKLNIFTDYLDAYLVALKNQKFKKIYIDAFAGTGKITTSDGQEFDGSARCALTAGNKFDFYYFIENDKAKAAELQNMINQEFSFMKRITCVYCDDANERLVQILKNIDWKYNRALLFLDPYAAQVNWTTLEAVTQTHSIDVWYLFPFSAMERMLPNDGNYAAWEKSLNRLLGDSSWQTELYKEDPQLSLFDSDSIIEDSNNSGEAKRIIKDAKPEQVKSYIIKRLKTIFPCVSDKPKIFRNSKNAPLFLLCFAISSESPRAQGLALRIADHILNR